MVPSRLPSAVPRLSLSLSLSIICGACASDQISPRECTATRDGVARLDAEKSRAVRKQSSWRVDACVDAHWSSWQPGCNC